MINVVFYDKEERPEMPREIRKLSCNSYYRITLVPFILLNVIQDSPLK